MLVGLCAVNVPPMNDIAARTDGLAGAHLQAVEWLSGGADVVLSVLTPTGPAVVTCRAVTGLAVDLAWRPGKSGLALSFACELERTVAGRWALYWTFPPQGFVSLECLEVQIAPAGAAAIG